MCGNWFVRGIRGLRLGWCVDVCLGERKCGVFSCCYCVFPGIFVMVDCFFERFFNTKDQFICVSGVGM